MFSAILIIMIMPFTDLGRSRGLQFRPLSKICFYIFVANFLILMQLGAKHVESPFIEFGQISTVLYFSHFLVIVPIVSLIENSLVDLHLSDLKKDSLNLNKYSLYLKKVINVVYYIISVIIILAILYFTYKLFICNNVLYCMDENSEEYLRLLEKIDKTKNNITYFKEQIKGCTDMFKQAIDGKDNQNIDDIKKILKETQTNLNSEEKMLNILNNKLQSGDYSLEVKTSSSLGKRSFND